MWGERAVGGFFEDIHVLIVVILGMSILLGSLASAYVAYEGSRERAEARAEAERILRAFLGDESLLHGGETALLEVDALDGLNATGLRRIAGSDLALELVVSERSGNPQRVFLTTTGPLAADRVSASTAACVWHSDLDVRAARVTVTVGR